MGNYKYIENASYGAHEQHGKSADDDIEELEKELRKTKQILREVKVTLERPIKNWDELRKLIYKLDL